MDTITDIFDTMHVTAVVNAKVEATAPRGLVHQAEEQAKHTQYSKTGISPFHLVHFGMISRGNCWLSLQGVSEPIPLTGGDCFLVAPGLSYTLRDHPRTAAKSFCAAAQKALQLLKQKDKKLVEVAQSVGYESDAAFSKAFKRVIGFTPGEYRHNGGSSNLRGSFADSSSSDIG